MALEKKKSKVCSRIKKIQHKWLFPHVLGQCPYAGIWALIFIEGHGMICGLCQMHDTSQPTTCKYGILLQKLDIDKKLFDFILTVLMKMEIQ